MTYQSGDDLIILSIRWKDAKLLNCMIFATTEFYDLIDLTSTLLHRTSTRLLLSTREQLMNRTTASCYVLFKRKIIFEINVKQDFVHSNQDDFWPARFVFQHQHGRGVPRIQDLSFLEAFR